MSSIGANNWSQGISPIAEGWRTRPGDGVGADRFVVMDIEHYHCLRE
jgi:hypothetical protein